MPAQTSHPRLYTVAHSPSTSAHCAIARLSTGRRRDMIAATTATTASGIAHPTKNEAQSATIAAMSAQGASLASSIVAVAPDGSQAGSSAASSATGPLTTTGSTPTGPVGSFV